MIKVLCETMFNEYDYSLKIKVINYPDLKHFKQDILKHYPKISITVPKENEEYWFGIRYGDTKDGFWFRWLYAIIDTERGCLYSIGNNTCKKEFALPEGKQHCSKEVYAMLCEIESEIKTRKQNIVFVE